MSTSTTSHISSTRQPLPPPHRPSHTPPAGPAWSGSQPQRHQPARPAARAALTPRTARDWAGRLFLGCHSDTGYAHQSRGLFSQLIIDESFEAEQHGPPSPEPPAHCFPEHCRRMAEHWVHILPPGAQASFAIDPSLSMNGFKSAKISVERGSAAIANRGQSGAGLYIEAQREYEGYFFAATEAGATVRASLYDRDSNASLGSSAPIHIAAAAATADAAGEKWTQYHFTLTTTGAAACTEASPPPLPLPIPTGAGHTGVRALSSLLHAHTRSCTVRSSDAAASSASK